MSSLGSLAHSDGRSETLPVASHGSKLRYLPNTFPTSYDAHSFPNRMPWTSSTTSSIGIPVYRSPVPMPYWSDR